MSEVRRQEEAVEVCWSKNGENGILTVFSALKAL